MLAGVKVLDFGRVVSGPFVGQILADLGADVIKIERLGLGDETRSYSTKPGSGKSSLFEALNRKKRSLSIDLGHPDARAVIARLLEGVDVVAHNFRPGVVERLGLAAEDVWKVNRRIVYCGISGYGDRGPMRYRAGNDVVCQAAGGLMSFTGDAAGPPVRVPIPIADYSSGLFATVGILAALNERHTTGRGRAVETSLMESLLSLECMHIGDYLSFGIIPPRLASGNMLGQPNQSFKTLDGALVIAVVNDPMWRRCAMALGGESLANDERFTWGRDRLAQKDLLAGLIEAITSTITSEECVRRLEEANVLCSPINDVAQVVADPQVRALGILQRFEDSTQEAEVVGSPLLIDGQRPPAGSRAPSVGQHTQEILREFGFSAEQISQLRASGVLPATPR